MLFRSPIALTAQGDTLVARLAPLWQALADSAEALNAEAGNVVALLDRLDDALDRQSLFDRVTVRIADNGAG